MIICINCRGNGYIIVNEEPVTCPQCNGSGDVPDPEEYD